MLKQDIKSAVIGELFRIAGFLVYYISLIALGIAIIWGSFWGSYHLVIDVLPEVHNGRAIIWIVLSVIGLCMLSIMLGLYLIKPLFAFKKDRNDTRVEVKATECPELFAMIRDVADKTKCKMPKHVYLSPDVNACVFYNTSFWSIFFPIKKNLEIGLGLFDGTSIEEVKSVIAHEFGHFSQNSMKVGSTVYVTNTVLHNLIYAEDFWDRLLDKWCLVDTAIIRWFGILTRIITNVIKRITFYIYKFVQKGYLKLSRYMEYDADNIACHCVGSANFISAMCKIDVLANKDNVYQHLLNSLLYDNKTVSNYFAGKQVVSSLIPDKDMPMLRYDVLLSKPVRTFDIKPRVKVEDIWSSHPALEDRLANAQQQNCRVEIQGQTVAAWTLIPKSISEKVSDNYLALIRENAEQQISDISDTQLHDWTQQQINDHFMDDRFSPFFGNTIYQFDIDKATAVPSESPFTESNAYKVAELTTYINDWNVLNQVNDGSIEAQDIWVDGIIYNKKNLPLEKFRAALDTLHDEVVEIYSNIFAYIGSQCDEEQRKLFRRGFVATFYARHISNDLLPQLFTHRENLCEELNKVTRRDEDEYNQLCSYVREYETHLKQVISNIDFELIGDTFIDNEYANGLKEYIKEEHNPQSSIDTDAINAMFQLTDSLDNMAQAIDSRARRVIYNITKEIIDKR